MPIGKRKAHKLQPHYIIYC